MRIVETDKYNGDYPDEKFLLFPMAEKHAKTIADAINEAVNLNSKRYWKVVNNDYTLIPGFEPMNINEIYENLCIKDSRNPNYSDIYGDGDDIPEPRKGCYCDNCHTGRDQLAVELVKLIEG